MVCNGSLTFRYRDVPVDFAFGLIRPSLMLVAMASRDAREAQKEVYLTRDRSDCLPSCAAPERWVGKSLPSTRSTLSTNYLAESTHALSSSAQIGGVASCSTAYCGWSNKGTS